MSIVLQKIIGWMEPMESASTGEYSLDNKSMAKPICL